MEFVQFHPTVLYIAGSARHLISEAARGEGAYLRDVTGYRFMGDYDQAMELAPRDVVSRAIATQMAKTRHPCVYLDLSHLPAGSIDERFPHIRKVCAEFGLDFSRDLIPVRPGAHYMIGGLTIDEEGRTTLRGLWAAGEVTSSGLHGANRLASNSLLEGLVFGLRAGRGSLASSPRQRARHLHGHSAQIGLARASAGRRARPRGLAELADQPDGDATSASSGTRTASSRPPNRSASGTATFRTANLPTPAAGRLQNMLLVSQPRDRLRRRPQREPRRPLPQRLPGDRSEAERAHRDR